MVLKHIGKICRDFRKERGITVDEIAEKTYYSKWNIYAFEEGKVNNIMIFLTYIDLGMTLTRRDICRVLKKY